MSRLRWFDIIDCSSADFTQLRGRILAAQIKPGDTSGFSISTSTQKQVEGKYVKKYEYTQKILDPFGKTYEIPIFGYDEVNFRLFSAGPSLELIRCPANSVNLLINQIYELLPAKRAISEASVLPLVWLEFLAPHLDGFEVTMASLRDVSITNSISAKVTLTGAEDVREAIRKLLGNRKYAVEKLRLNARYSGQDIKIELHSEGNATYLPVIDNAPEILRESLSKARKKSKV